MVDDGGPAWLGDARRAALGFKAASRGARGAGHSVYVVLLQDRRRPQPWGLYVGQTSRDPDLRFDQHKAGIRAAGSVLKRGLEVLTGPALHLQWIARAEAARIEVEFAEALRAAGLLVQGGH